MFLFVFLFYWFWWFFSMLDSNKKKVIKKCFIYFSLFFSSEAFPFLFYLLSLSYIWRRKSATFVVVVICNIICFFITTIIIITTNIDQIVLLLYSIVLLDHESWICMRVCGCVFIELYHHDDETMGCDCDWLVQISFSISSFFINSRVFFFVLNMNVKICI